MTVKEIIDGLKFTVDMFLFDPTTGETYKEPRNDMDKTTIDACKGAIELLEQTRWIPVSERLPEERNHYLVTIEIDAMNGCKPYYEIQPSWYSDKQFVVEYKGDGLVAKKSVIAWMPLPEPYRESEE